MDVDVKAAVPAEARVLPCLPDRKAGFGRRQARRIGSGLMVALWVAGAQGVGPRVAGAQAAASPVQTESVPALPSVSSPSAALLEGNGHAFLYMKQADEVRPPASMAKIMTLVLALEALQKGQVHLDDLVPVSDEAYRTGGSQIWLEPGEVLPFRQLVLAVAVASANDAAVAVAEHLSGSTDSFVAEMNAKAQSLGMTHTRFVNANGLDEAGTETETTARDMAILGAYAARVPGLLRLASIREDRSIRDGKGGHLWLVNHNRKLLSLVPGADGIKTGYTSRAGYCVTATAKRGGLRLVAVVMGAPTARTRNEDAATLLNWGFAYYRAVPAVVRGQVLAEIPVRGGRSPRVSAVARESTFFTVLSQSRPERSTIRVSVPSAVLAPVRRGRLLGTARITLAGKSVQVTLVAKDRVERASPFDFFRSMLSMRPGAGIRRSAGRGA